MMEGWERPPHRRSRSKNASFSSSLLDAIYRSIDDDVDNSKSGETRGRVPDRSFSHRKQVEPVTHSRNGSRAPVVSELAVSGPGVTDYYRRSPCGVGTFAPTSSSSSSSSSSSITRRINATGLFSSSDGESNQSDRIPRPDSPATKKKAKPKCNNLRSGLRGLRKHRTASDAAAATSPRARLVRFIIALFSAAGSSRKPKIAVPSTAAAKGGARTEESTTTSSSASSCMGTCLSKASEASRRQAAGAEKGKRSVRFYPVNVIVDEDYSRPCGHKRLQDGAANAAARVKELVRPGGEEEEDDDGGSESSSDLFELENLTEESTTTSSSASSCMGTCLSKASEASRRQAAGAEKGKRSVRFYPVNVIVDEDYSRPCGHKRLQDGAANAAARVKELVRPGGEEEEDDDGGSESSSDLFELENLTEVMGEGRGGGRCRNELPLYETTNLNKNRAIARGLIL
ncbi:hypothetical protein C4D60_Mb07t26340 [Musa balbisiana]|uniref:Uncharacterized protein n=1 Tax=Musa balbisiana TaxID=52838 RepID=A0A4S8JIX0_MUSBA|nr:hypothetical protein C4D60_Mb07t26340 [Musa balbisiana]